MQYFGGGIYLGTCWVSNRAQKVKLAVAWPSPRRAKRHSMDNSCYSHHGLSSSVAGYGNSLRLRCVTVTHIYVTWFIWSKLLDTVWSWFRSPQGSVEVTFSLSLTICWHFNCSDTRISRYGDVCGHSQDKCKWTEPIALPIVCKCRVTTKFSDYKQEELTSLALSCTPFSSFSITCMCAYIDLAF